MYHRRRLLRAVLSSVCALLLWISGRALALEDQGVEIAAALERAGENRVALEKALADVSFARRVGLEFLIRNMPERDLKTLSADFLLENVNVAYDVMDKVPWGKTIPQDLFLNDVLPYASINERRDAWRKSFVEKFLPVVADCRTAAEAAQRLNEKMFGIVKVRYSTKRRKADQSPFESMESGLASCTGLSVLLTDACRSVGVPARMVGIASWVNKRGNHTWVEVWDRKWHFTGAAEPSSKGLNHTWFQRDAALAKKDTRRHAIWATSFRRTKDTFPMVWAHGQDDVFAINVTGRYTGATTPSRAAKSDSAEAHLLVRVLQCPGGPRVAANVRVEKAGSQERLHAGTSKDERADTNDILTFRVAKLRKYTIVAEQDGVVARHECEIGSESQRTLTLHLEETARKAKTPPPNRATPDTSAEAALPKTLREECAVAVREYFRKVGAARGGDGSSREDNQAARWKFDASLDAALLKSEAAVRQVVWEEYVKAPIHGELKANFDKREVRYQTHVSPYTVKEVGKKPVGGWPLFIAMHGGGGAPKRVNDRGWQVMQRYYRDHPEAGGYLYLALRAPNDKWNGFYDGYVYPLVTNLVRQFLLFGGVEADKVFLMGYSHGGYGAFAIGPKIPYRFAAVHSSAAAPTDGESSAKTLRHTVFTFMIGEHDNAYGRLKRCKAFDVAIQKLRGDRDDIYPVKMEYKAGFGHGGLPDRDKIKDMYGAVRNPVPRDLVWEMTDGVVRDFFWLRSGSPGKGKEVWAECRENRVRVEAEGIDGVTVYLDSRLIDFGRDLEVEFAGRKRVERVQPSLRTLCDSLLERGDIGLAFSVRLELQR